MATGWLRGKVAGLRQRVRRSALMREKCALPKQLHIEVTWDCNLECGMCPRSRGQTTHLSGRSLGADEFAGILGRIPSVQHVNIIGAGEPLVHPQFSELVTTAREQGMTLSVTTNGTLLHERGRSSLAENVNLICVSIDDSDPDEYAKMRVGADLHQVLENMRGLHAERPELPIVIQALMTRGNLERLPGLVDVAAELGARLALLHPIAFDETLDRDTVHHDPERYAAFLSETSSRAAARQVGVVMRPSRPRRQFCGDPWYSPLVTIEGDVYPCCYIYEARAGARTFREYYLGEHIEVPMQQFRAGNIFTDSFDEMWNGECFRSVRRSVLRARKRQHMTPEDLLHLRASIDLGRMHSYCAICLYQWGCAC